MKAGTTIGGGGGQGCTGAAASVGPGTNGGGGGAGITIGGAGRTTAEDLAIGTFPGALHVDAYGNYMC